MKETVYFIVLTAIVHILSACSGSTVYDEYAHTQVQGTSKNCFCSCGYSSQKCFDDF